MKKTEEHTADVYTLKHMKVVQTEPERIWLHFVCISSVWNGTTIKWERMLSRQEHTFSFCCQLDFTVATLMVLKYLLYYFILRCFTNHSNLFPLETNYRLFWSCFSCWQHWNSIRITETIVQQLLQTVTEPSSRIYCTNYTKYMLFFFLQISFAFNLTGQPTHKTLILVTLKSRSGP